MVPVRLHYTYQMLLVETCGQKRALWSNVYKKTNQTCFVYLVRPIAVNFIVSFVLKFQITYLQAFYSTILSTSDKRDVNNKRFLLIRDGFKWSQSFSI